jgi:hypothetical protein
VLGYAHRACLDRARQRLEAGAVPLPANLPRALLDEPDEDPPPLHRPPTGESCPFCGSDGPLSDEHVWPKWLSRPWVSAVLSRSLASMGEDGLTRSKSRRQSAGHAIRAGSLYSKTMPAGSSPR